jgi:hypothetical protein
MVPEYSTSVWSDTFPSAKTSADATQMTDAENDGATVLGYIGTPNLRSAHLGNGFVTDDDTYTTYPTSYWDTFRTDAGTPGPVCLY